MKWEFMLANLEIVEFIAIVYNEMFDWQIHNYVLIEFVQMLIANKEIKKNLGYIFGCLFLFKLKGFEF